MSREDLMKLGLNHSTVHTDFMIGTPDLKIMGTTFAGEEIIIFKDGNFVM
jgi:aminopeptidase